MFLNELYFYFILKQTMRITWTPVSSQLERNETNLVSGPIITVISVVTVPFHPARSRLQGQTTKQVTLWALHGRANCEQLPPQRSTDIEGPEEKERGGGVFTDENGVRAHFNSEYYSKRTLW